MITLVYQPFVLTTTALFAYHEAKINTRMRNLARYMLFFLSSFGVIVVSLAEYHLSLSEKRVLLNLNYIRSLCGS
jgi:hypothetical protein